MNEQEELIREIEQKGVRDPRVLKAIANTPRRLYVPEEQASLALVDRALPIGFDQTISQPSLVALITELAEIEPESVVLEVGGGSGYQASILAKLARRVVVIEQCTELALRARQAWKKEGLTNLVSVIGDGSLGYQPYAPYDAVVMSCAAPSPPTALMDQLSTNGGRLIAPIGGRESQRLTVYTRQGDELSVRHSVECAFVPLLGEGGYR
ncbi:MAG: protein-L-isoaspartate(D-aspartate) O-methyltransferase [Armatimonadetes bacterium]|nr:protein-L-isoaspartate(D-aspartate) O-methyltransferase [Armatimonadota bacterium]